MSQSLNSGPFRKMDGEQSGGPKSGTWSLHTIDTCVVESVLYGMFLVCYHVSCNLIPAGSQYAHNSYRFTWYGF